MNMIIWLSLLAVLALLLISALFSAAETGFTAASRARIHRLAQEDNRRAHIVELLFTMRERVIGSILLANNMLNILASALTTSLLISLFGSTGVVYATIIMTILVLIFGEVLPKTYAIGRPERVALSLGALLLLMTRLLAPLLILVERIVRGLLKLAGAGKGDSFLTSQEEIRGAIELHAHEGGLIREHQHMLGSILDLDEVLVGDVMVHRQQIEMIDADEPPDKIIRHITRSSHTRIPLYRDNPDNIIGIIHAKDVLRALNRRGATPTTINIARIMSTPVFVPNTTTLREQLSAFIAARNHFALVVDEYGGLQGLVTLEDILEEIVGDIADEHDLPIPEGVSQLDDGALQVEGGVTLRDLNRRFDWSLPDEDATTIAGLLLNEARTIPQPGQRFSFFGFGFEVLERQRNRITLLRLEPPEPVTLDQTKPHAAEA